MIPKLLVAGVILMATAGINIAIAQNCVYVDGDVNGSGHYSGLDIVYAVRYLKGGPPPPYSCECPPGSGHFWYVAGDANGSCSFNGLDIVFMVSSFRRDPWSVGSCPLCPGVHGLLKNAPSPPTQAK